MKNRNEYLSKITGTINSYDPLEKYQKTLGAMTNFENPLAQYQKTLTTMAKFEDPLEKYRKTLITMTNFENPLEKYRKTLTTMTKFENPLEKYRKTLTTMTNFENPLAQYQKTLTTMAKFEDPLEKYQKTFGTISKIKNLLKEQQSDLFSFNLRDFKNTAIDVNKEITINDSGNISLSSTQILASELQSISNDIINNSTASISQSIEEAVNKLIIEIQKQKEPKLQKILMWFMYPLIFGIILAFINPVAEQIVRSNFSQSKKEIAKELRLNVQSSVQRPEILKYVSADSLNVRAGASIKSDLIGELYFSSVVLIIEKRKNWSLIEWNNPDANIAVKGWVFSRYLKSFK